jgi:ubiquinone/menaquinone biosynthesis C-methylase UbiE
MWWDGSFAWSYDLVAAVVSLGQWNHWVGSVLPYLPGVNILEIGHGPGHLQRLLKRFGQACTCSAS